jgi:hypothetical protein
MRILYLGNLSPCVDVMTFSSPHIYGGRDTGIKVKQTQLNFGAKAINTTTTEILINSGSHATVCLNYTEQYYSSRNLPALQSVALPVTVDKT